MTRDYELRQSVQELVKRTNSDRKAIRELIKAELGIRKRPGARDALLHYLKKYVGMPIAGTELEVVSGISEYARRVRELRVELGYDIVAAQGTYTLRSTVPDEQKVKRWRTAAEIRRLPGSAKSRMLTLLQRYVGIEVNGDELFEVSRVKEFGRRLRELRTEDGWRLVTRNTGRPDLAPSVYVLESLDQLPIHDRKIPDEVYEGVLERDGFSCRKCGWNVSRQAPGSRRQFLEVHHRRMHSTGGCNSAENLVTLCNVHHDQVHRDSIDENQIGIWLDHPPDLT